MPPASRSRSITVTGSIPGPSAPAIAGLQRPCDLSAAVEPLAAAHQRPGPATEAVGVGGRDRPAEGGVDLPSGDPLAEADDAAIVRHPADQLVVLVGA